MKLINHEYLRRAAKAPDIAALKQRAYLQLRLSKGAHVVDIGCGPGIDTPALAEIVGPTGSVLGIDADPSAVAAANAAIVEAGIGTYVKHVTANALKLPVESNSADAVFCERVLQHIPWAQCSVAINEMLRVLKPGGRLVIIDTDWATFSLALIDPILERRVVAEHLYEVANPLSGRYLLSLLRDAGGLEEVTNEPNAVRVNYESAIVLFFKGDTIRRGVETGRLTPLDSENFKNALDGARDYRIWSAHLTLVLATATKGSR